MALPKLNLPFDNEAIHPALVFYGGDSLIVTDDTLQVDMAGFYLNEAHKRYVKRAMAARAAQPRVTLEEALAQYDKICWRQKLGIRRQVIE